MKLSNPDHKLFVKAFGKFFEVAHIAKTVDEANQFMSANTDCGLIDSDEKAGLYFIAKITSCTP